MRFSASASAFRAHGLSLGLRPYPKLVEALRGVLRERDENPVGLRAMLKWRVPSDALQAALFRESSRSERVGTMDRAKVFSIARLESEGDTESCPCRCQVIMS